MCTSRYSSLLYVIVFSLILRSPLHAQNRSAVIRSMINNISRQRMTTDIDQLQQAGGHWSRVTYTPGNDSAVQYIYQQFKQIPGLTSVVLDTFYITEAQSPYDTKPLFNVVATIKGKKDPNSVVVIGAHLDCSASRMGAAIWHQQWDTMRVPGADDNASGVAAVLELARVMSDPSFTADNENTIIFAAFGAEESGLVHPAYLVGSSHFASGMTTSRANVLAMVSLDMIGFNDKNNMYLNIAADTKSQWIGKHIAAMNDTFSVGMILNPAPFAYGTWSDHASFWTQGFSAVCLIECAPPWISNQFYDASPYYHKTSDTLGTLNMELVERSTQLALASSATLAGHTPSTVRSIAGTPASFRLRQNYPNPFNAGTRIEFSVKQSGNTALRIYNTLGNEVAAPVNEHREPGNYSVHFTPGNLPSGVYFYRLMSANTSITRAMVLIK